MNNRMNYYTAPFLLLQKLPLPIHAHTPHAHLNDMGSHVQHRHAVAHVGNEQRPPHSQRQRGSGAALLVLCLELTISRCKTRQAGLGQAVNQRILSRPGGKLLCGGFLQQGLCLCSWLAAHGQWRGRLLVQGRPRSIGHDVLEEVLCTKGGRLGAAVAVKHTKPAECHSI